MNQRLKARLLDIVARDKNINYEDFERYVSSNFSVSEEKEITKQAPVAKITMPRGKIKNAQKSSRTLKFNDDNAIRDIAGAKSRPGLNKPALKRYPDLKEDPDEHSNTYEVYYSDPISISEYRQMARDPQLKLGLLLIVGLVSGLKYSISCEDKVIKEVLKKIYGRHHNSLVRKMIRISFREGFAFAEKIYQRETVTVEGYSGKAVGLREISFQDPLNNFSFFKSTLSNQIHSVSQRQLGQVVTLERSRLLWFSLDEEFGEVFGESRFKPAYVYWYYDQIGYQWRISALEKTGSPHLEGRYPHGSTSIGSEVQDNSEIILNLLVNLTQTGVVSLPSARDDHGNLLWDIKYNEPQNTKSEAFDNFSLYNDRKKLDAIGIMGTIFEQGSFSDTDAKADLLMAIMEDAINQIEETISSDIVDYLVSYNFGPDRVNEVKFEIDRTGLGRRSMLKEILVTAMRLQNSVPNYRPSTMVDIKDLADEFGITTAQFEDVMEVDPEKKAQNESQQKDPQTPEQAQQRVEDGNGQNRPTNPPRDRGRKADNKSAV